MLLTLSIYRNGVVKMGSKVFTTKKMKLEKKAWLKKGLIGSAIVAVLASAVFGTYMLVNEDKPSSGRRSHQSASTSNSILPAFATSESAQPRSRSFSKLGFDSEKKSSTKGSKHLGKKKDKHKKLASKKDHKKSKAKKFAGAKKSKKDKLAAHKKHGKKQLTHKKHKGAHKLAQK